MSVDALIAHLQSGTTHTCYCWMIKRQDGVTLGFTDHDRRLTFDGVTFAPETGLTATALASATGLSINNTEAIGALSSDAITEADVYAGRYDDAEVRIWLVCWDDPEARKPLFVGSLGEITREDDTFHAELQGLSAQLNKPQGRSYLKRCSARLGDGHCGVNLDDPAYRLDFTLAAETDGLSFDLSAISNFHEAWFEGGQLTVLTGAATGLSGLIKSDVGLETRQIRLWTPIAAPIAVGDQLRLTAGCDKAALTCREKFANLLNFRGFPDIPGDDWLVSVPRSDQSNRGGSLFR